MTTLEEQLARLQEKHDAEVQKLTNIHALECQLPVPPERVTWFEVCPWVAYEAKTLGEALDILEQFKLVQFQEARNGTTVITPKELLAEKYRDKCFDTKYTCMIQLTYDLYTPAPAGYSSLTFWAKAGENLVKVTVRFGAGYIGCNPELTLQRKVNLNLERICWDEPTPPTQVSRAIRWGGHSADSCSVDWLFAGVSDADVIARLRKGA